MRKLKKCYQFCLNSRKTAKTTVECVYGLLLEIDSTVIGDCLKDHSRIYKSYIFYYIPMYPMVYRIEWIIMYYDYFLSNGKNKKTKQ
jgi:hypothetical protein